jgi:hypothetical protein
MARMPKSKSSHGIHSGASSRNQIESEIQAALECASSACAFEGGSRAAALQMQPGFHAHSAKYRQGIYKKTKSCVSVLWIFIFNNQRGSFFSSGVRFG